MEVEYLGTEAVGHRRRVEVVPSTACIRGVKVLLVAGDEVSPIIRVAVVIEGEETLLREELTPRVTFIAGLPDGVVAEAY